MSYNPAVTELKKLMKKYNISQKELVIRAFLHQSRLCEILHNKRRISLETDIKLAKIFNLNPGYFIQLQLDTEIPIYQKKYQLELSKIIPL